MSKRTSLAAVIVLFGTALAAPGAAAAKPPGHGSDGVRNVIPITQILAFGQKVTAVAVEYSSEVNARTLDRDTYTVSDSLYNFRFNPVADLTDPTKRANRTIAAVYTNEAPTLNADRQSDPGTFVIIELDATDPGGNTIMATGNFVTVNTDLQTRVVQNQDVHAQPGNGKGRGPRLAAASDEAYGPTKPAVNLLADDFVYKRFVTSSGTMIPYAYHLPEGYDAARTYPVVVILPGQGMGFNGSNEGVQVAADIPATAWLQEKWTGTDEDVIVLAPQNQRVGTAAAQAEVMVELLNAFAGEFPVDQNRIYASTVSYGSTLAWAALATHPGLFDGALITEASPPARPRQPLSPRPTHRSGSPTAPMTTCSTWSRPGRRRTTASGTPTWRSGRPPPRQTRWSSTPSTPTRRSMSRTGTSPPHPRTRTRPS